MSEQGKPTAECGRATASSGPPLPQLLALGCRHRLQAVTGPRGSERTAQPMRHPFRPRGLSLSACAESITPGDTSVGDALYMATVVCTLSPDGEEGQPGGCPACSSPRSVSLRRPLRPTSVALNNPHRTLELRPRSNQGRPKEPLKELLAAVERVSGEIGPVFSRNSA